MNITLDTSTISNLGNLLGFTRFDLYFSFILMGLFIAIGNSIGQWASQRWIISKLNKEENKMDRILKEIKEIKDKGDKK